MPPERPGAGCASCGFAPRPSYAVGYGGQAGLARPSARRGSYLIAFPYGGHIVNGVDP